MRSKIALLLAITTLAVGCKHENVLSSGKAENPPARKIIGKGAAIQALDTIEYARIKESMGYRRQVAWSMLAKLVAPIKVAYPGKNVKDGRGTLPLWRTWYEQGEILSMFETAYYKLTDTAAKKRARICESDIAAAFDGLVGRNLEDFGFTVSDFEKKLGQFQWSVDVEGVPGTGFTMFSPGVAAHYLRNYRAMIACSKHERGDETGSQLNRSFCMDAEFPTGIAANPAYNAATLDYSHCEGAQSPIDDTTAGMAVAVKANWFTARPGQKIAVFDTSASGLRDALTSGEFVAKSTADADDIIGKSIYTIAVRPNINSDLISSVGLAAAHFALKQFPDWMWITIWWSPDPNSDFGSDRPDEIQGPWRNYKMCVVTDFDDDRNSIDADFHRQYPDLAEALTEAYTNPAMAAGHSWCSNPFIERGKFNARTNCIGCHQHAGAGEMSPLIFQGDESAFPHSARAKVRKNFPGDYLFSFDQNPDYFQHEIREIVRSRESGIH
jgi:hypothetical protein